MHYGFSACLRLDFFFHVTFFTFPIFLPTKFWDYVLPTVRKTYQKQVVYFNGSSNFSHFFVLLLKELFFTSNTTIDSVNNIKKKMDIKDTSYIWLAIYKDGVLNENISALPIVLELCPLLWVYAYILKKLPSRESLENIFLIAHFYTIKKEQVTKIQNPKQKTNIATTSTIYAEKAKSLKKTKKQIVFTTKQIILSSFVLTVIVWNCGNIPGVGLPFEVQPWMRTWAHTIRLEQMWNMFSPRPQQTSNYFVIPGELVDGTQIELFHNGGLHTWIPNKMVNWNEPDPYHIPFKNHRWLKFTDFLRISTFPEDIVNFGRFICREYNKRQPNIGSNLFTFQIYLMEQRVFPNNTWTEIVPRSLHSHVCFDGRPEIPSN